jgi:hypothetical protein
MPHPDGRANPSAYAEMVAADRQLPLAGYEVYRVGGQELVDRDAAGQMLNGLFEVLPGLVGSAAGK